MEQSESKIIIPNFLISIDDLKEIIQQDGSDIYQFLDNKEDSSVTEESKRALHLCQNALCNHDETPETIFHLFEIDQDNQIIICQHCYSDGYRFCLVTHQVLPIDQLNPVLDGMYVEKHFQDFFDCRLLNQISDLNKYYRMIGVDNPNPTHIITNLIPQTNNKDQLDRQDHQDHQDRQDQQDGEGDGDL